MKKRLLSMILALSMMLTILPVNAITALAEIGKVVKSGNCGINGESNVTYTLTQNNDDSANPTYTLTISGSGEMENYGNVYYNYAPWVSVNQESVRDNITQVVFDGDITTIGSYSFHDCTALTSITIPDSVTSIGNNAFQGCSRLTTVTMPDNENSKLTSIGENAFWNCFVLTSIVIPNSVTSIGAHAFHKLMALTSITIPDSVISIGEGAFSGCNQLITVTMPDNENSKLTSISNSMFFDCTALTSIVIPDSVTSIGVSAFQNCNELTSITISDNVNLIGTYAFWGCTKLKTVTLPKNFSEIQQYAFSKIASDIKFYYPGNFIEWQGKQSCINRQGYYAGYTSNYDLGENSYKVCYLCDVTFNPNGGTFEDGITDSKVVHNVWRWKNVENTDIPQNPTRTGYTFVGWSIEKDKPEKKVDPANIGRNVTNGNFDGVKSDMTLYALYTKNIETATVTIGKINNGGELVKDNSYEFTVTIEPKDDKAAGKTGKLTFNDTTGLKYWDGSEWAVIPTGGVPVDMSKDSIEQKFQLTPSTADNNQTLTATLTKEDNSTVTGSTNYNVREHQPAEVTIGGLDTDNTVKAGNDKTFTVKVDPKDDAGTDAKVTVSVDGTNKDAVEKIQYKDGETWKDIPSDGLSIDDINNTEFKLITKADANDGDVTITVAAKKADGTEIDKKDATITVKKHENAEVTIDGLDTDHTVKAGNDKTFTVSVTPNDDANTGAKATIEVSGANADAVEKIQYKDGETWKDIPSDGLSIDDINNTEFKIITKADANDGDVTITVAAKKADGTEIDKKDATITVKKHENATVTIDGLDDDLKQDESKNFTVKVDPKDDSGKATIDFGDKNNEIQYKDPDDGQWKDMPNGGLKIDLSDGAKDYEFRITPKNEGDQTLTATVKQGDTKLGETTKDFTVAKKDEPVNPNPGGNTNPGGDGGNTNPGGDGGNTNPGGDGGNTNPGGDGGNTNPGGDGGNTNPGGDGGNTKPGGDSGNTGDGDHTGDKDPETKSYELTVIGGSFTAKQGENALTVETTKADNSLTAKIPEGAVVTVTLNKDAVPEGMVFDQWKINDDDLMGNPDVAYDQETFHFTMPEHDVKVEVMYRDATIESDGPGILGTGAMIATVGISAAALAYQGHMLGTEFALRCMLPEWALIPQNRAELAVLLWSDAEGPEPVSTNLYSDISEDDSAVQKAARWAVENDLMELLDAEEAPENFDPFVPVTYLDSIHAWKKAQELKK